MEYIDFLKTKINTLELSGFDVNEKDLNNNLFDFQKHIVKKALKNGKYAIFADCGLGKTIMQLEWSNQVVKHTNKSVLILTPLAVSAQTIQEGLKFGINVTKLQNDNYKNEIGIYISNYEQLNNIDCEVFSGVVLDESSILKNYEGKIKTLIIDSFYNTNYKLCCTATPSPNDPMELGNHSEFLNIMTRSEILAMYFIHDGGNTSKWRLKKHSESVFYSFVSNWASMLSSPSDIGFNGDNYILPALNMIEKQIETEKRENGMLYNDTSVSAIDFNKELRLTKIERMEEVAQIVNNSDERFIIWINQNSEEDYLKQIIKDCVIVNGSETTESKETKLLDFANNKYKVLITKKKIAQYGMNFQNCNNQIFASLDFSFEGLYQAIRRSYRFGQKNAVNVYIITTDTMQNVIDSINKKQEQFLNMQSKMNKIINQENKTKEMNITKEINELYHIECGDSIQLINTIESNTIDFSIFSPPFADLYTYSDKIEDLGNSKNYKEFLVHFQYLCKELYRIIKSGRNVAIHCMDLPIQKGKEGYIGLRDFSGMIIEAMQNEGFIYHSRITIWKDPVIEMQRTKALGLLHKQVKKDSTKSRVGIPDYVLVFKKDGENETPVNCDINVDTWQKYASPIWYDINYSNTLQNFRQGRSDQDEKHICPLQLDTIQRLIHLYTNKNELVFTPFLGIGSEVYQAVKMDRRGIGFELKESYFELAKQNIKNIYVEKTTTQQLF